MQVGRLIITVQLNVFLVFLRHTLSPRLKPNISLNWFSTGWFRYVPPLMKLPSNVCTCNFEQGHLCEHNVALVATILRQMGEIICESFNLFLKITIQALKESCEVTLCRTLINRIGREKRTLTWISWFLLCFAFLKLIWFFHFILDLG